MRNLAQQMLMPESSTGAGVTVAVASGFAFELELLELELFELELRELLLLEGVGTGVGGACGADWAAAGGCNIHDRAAPPTGAKSAE